MSEGYFSQLHGNAHKETRKRKYFIQGVMKKKKFNKISDKLKQGLLIESKK